MGFVFHVPQFQTYDKKNKNTYFLYILDMGVSFRVRYKKEKCWSEYVLASSVSPGAVPALPRPHRLQPVHRVRLPRLHEHGGVWLLCHPHHPLQQLLLSELPQQEEAEVKGCCSVLSTHQCPIEGAIHQTIWRFSSNLKCLVFFYSVQWQIHVWKEALCDHSIIYS